LWDRWTDEIGEHKKTVGRAERAENRKRDMMSERDRLLQDITGLRKENEDLRLLAPILTFYGPEAKIVMNYNLNKEVGSFVTFGHCPKIPCFRITLLGIHKADRDLIEALGLSEDTSVAELRLSGAWEGAPSGTINGFTAPLALLRGRSVTLEMNVYNISFVIEIDRISYLRAGIGLSPGTLSEKGFRTGKRGEGC
jgi:hypothetical protein